MPVDVPIPAWFITRIDVAQYASAVFHALLARYAMTCSMSRKGNCWDNAPTETFFNSLKNERIHGQRYRTRDEAKADVFAYIQAF